MNSASSSDPARPFETGFRRFATPRATPRSGDSEAREEPLSHAPRVDRSVRALRVLALVEARALLSLALDRYGVADEGGAEEIVGRALTMLTNERAGREEASNESLS